MSRSEIAIYSALCLIWSTTWLAIRVGVQYLPPFGFAAARFLIATAIVGAAIAIRQPAGIAKAPWLSLLVTGFLQFGVSYGLVFWAEQEVTAGFASLSFASIPLMVAVLARFMLGERLHARKIGGIALGVAGILFLFVDQFSATGRASVAAEGAMLIAAFSSSLANILVQRDQAHVSKRVAITAQMVVGTICLFAASAILEPHAEYRWNRASIIALLFLAIFGSAIAFVLYYWLLHRATAVKATTVAFVAPVLTVLQGHYFLQETLGWNHLLGGLFILAGSALVVLSPSGPQAQI